MRIVTLFVLGTVLLVITGCDGTESDWKAAQQANTVAAYSDFMAKHPQGLHMDEAKKAIEDLDWTDAKARNTVDLFNAYLAKYAQGRHVADARSALDELDWAQAKAMATTKAYEQYLGAQGERSHKAEATTAVDDLAFDAARQTNTVQAFQEYLAAFRDGMHRNDAGNRRDDLIWARAKQAGDTLSLQAYLEGGPDGTHRKEALAILTSIRDTQLNVALKNALLAYRKRDEEANRWQDQLALSTTAPAKLAPLRIKEVDGCDVKDLVYSTKVIRATYVDYWGGKPSVGRGSQIRVDLSDPAHSSEDKLTIEGVADGAGWLETISNLRAKGGVAIKTSDGQTYKRVRGHWVGSKDAGEKYPILPGQLKATVPNPGKVGDCITNSIGMNLTYVPAGEFRMGANLDPIEANERYGIDVEWAMREIPQHRVVLRKAFMLGVYSVTQAQWRVVMGSNPSRFTDSDSRTNSDWRPVEGISWDDAMEFCRRLSKLEAKQYRLPTEAEWEYACRAGTATEFYFGDDASTLGDYAWSIDNSDECTQPVGQKKPNAWGLYDMNGNVLQWCSDEYREYSTEAPEGTADAASTTTQPAKADHVARGSHWSNGDDGYLRSAARYRLNSDFKLFAITGLRVVTDIPEPSAESVRKAAEQGDAHAQLTLAKMCFAGEGMAKDTQQAIDWYRKAAVQGNAEAQFRLGTAYESGTAGIAPDARQALEWYRKAAEQQHADAQFRLAEMYAKGEGVPKDDREATVWFKAAAEHGQADAQWRMGQMAFSNWGIAASLKPDTYITSDNIKQALGWYRKAAVQGCAQAQRDLALMYGFGIGMKQDAKEEVFWNRKAADQGIVAAQHRLGYAYHFGNGVSKDVQQALFWYGKAANQGSMESECNMGYIYQHGEGVPKDIAKAIALYRASAERGDGIAARNLAWVYDSGDGVDKDPVAAYMWATLAVKQNDEKAPLLLKDIERTLTADQIANGRRMADEWLQQHAKHD